MLYNLSNKDKETHNHLKRQTENVTFEKFCSLSFYLGVEENFLNLKKGIYKNPTANIVLNMKGWMLSL